jgi:hypothetical protein
VKFFEALNRGVAVIKVVLEGFWVTIVPFAASCLKKAGWEAVSAILCSSFVFPRWEE